MHLYRFFLVFFFAEFADSFMVYCVTFSVIPGRTDKKLCGLLKGCLKYADQH